LRALKLTERLLRTKNREERRTSNVSKTGGRQNVRSRISAMTLQRKNRERGRASVERPVFRAERTYEKYLKKREFGELQ